MVCDKLKLDDKYFFDLRQETLYYNNDLLGYKWYRKLFGGKWYLVKFGKDTPNIMMFATWTKRPDFYSGFKKVIEKEEYKETLVDTKYKLIKEFIKQYIFRK